MASAKIRMNGKKMCQFSNKELHEKFNAAATNAKEKHKVRMEMTRRGLDTK